MVDLPALLRPVLAEASANVPVRCVWIAYSGGLDSQVLLHAATQARASAQTDLRALHVHHGLHPHADAWAEFCREQCASLGIPCQIEPVQVALAAGASLEAQARQARYAAFRRVMAAGDVLCTAHHADDQAETLLLQLLRGAGPAGLAAMPARAALGQGILLRPFLQQPRAALHAWAQAAGLRWLEDPSNADTRHERNFLRHDIVPQLRARRAGVVAALCRAARHQAQALAVLEEVAEEDLARARATNNGLRIAPLLALSAARRANVLRLWLKQQGVAMPPESRLQQISATLLTARADGQPEVTWCASTCAGTLPGVRIVRYRNVLFALTAPPPLTACASTLPMVWRGDKSQALALPGGVLRTELRDHGPRLALAWHSADWDLRPRLGGEACQHNGQRHALKKRLQEAGIPAWQRPYLPLVYLAGQWAAAPGLLVCDAFQAAPGAPGWALEWRAQQ